MSDRKPKDSHQIDFDVLENSVRQILEAIGEDVSREGLKDTPYRVSRLYEELFSGMSQDPMAILETTFNEGHFDPVVIANIPFLSICEHHLLPFFGHANVGYIPKGKVLGASKIARVLDIFSRRPQIQERLTSQLANSIQDTLLSEATYVVLSAEHMCMGIRGVKKPGSLVVTVSQVGSSTAVKELKSLMRKIS